MRYTVLILSLLAPPAVAQSAPLTIEVQPRVAQPDDEDTAGRMPTVASLFDAGASALDLFDRCAAFQSTLVTLLAADRDRPHLAMPHRAQFSEFTQRALDARKTAGLSDAEAEAQTRDSILELARLYMTHWNDALSRTGSAFSAPLRRMDQASCTALLQGSDPVDRPSLREQLGATDLSDME